MGTCLLSTKNLNKDVAASGNALPGPFVEIEAALLTGGIDRSYAFGMAVALASRGVRLDVIGSDDVDSPEMHTTPRLNFLNLRGSKREAGLARKMTRVLLYYARLLGYAAAAKAKIFHILWNNKFEFIDRTLILVYYKLLGKKVVLTAHNVNAGKRDANDSLLNRSTLKLQYLLANHIFVHTEKMKNELRQDFRIKESKVTVIPFGINNAVPRTDLSPREAKKRLGIGGDERTILFFGAIRPYKGLEYLVSAFQQLVAAHPEYRLIIAGEPRRESEQYSGEIQRAINAHASRGLVLQKFQYIPDEETELYFKAADVLALPYTHVFQSGVLFLGYSFGLPVVGAEVGSVGEEILEGRTGFLCRPCDSADLAKAIEKYFESDLFKNLERRRQDICDYANAKHSWDIVGEKTRDVYAHLLRAREI